MTLLLEEATPLHGHTEGAPPAEPPPESAPDSPRWGRRIAIGFGAASLLMTAAVAAVAAPHLGAGTGDRTYHPTTFADVEHDYRFGIGSLTVDRRDVDFPPGVHVVAVDHGIGSARVLLPEGVEYDVSGDVEAGELVVLDASEDGFDNAIDVRSGSDAAATVIVDLQVDIGYGQVRQG